MREISYAALPFAAFLVVGPALLLLIETPGTPGFVITVFTLLIGVIFMALVLVLHVVARRLERRYEGSEIHSGQSASPRGGAQ